MNQLNSRLAALRRQLGDQLAEVLFPHLQHYTQQAEERLWTQRWQQAGAAGTPTIPTWTRRTELEALYWLAASLPQGAQGLEIGSYLGASTCFLALGLSKVNGHLFCVDTWRNETMPEGGQDTWRTFRHNTHLFAHRITAYRKRSEELLASDVPAPLHLVLIDGDHSYAAAKADSERVIPWLAADGLLIFHDSNSAAHPGVSQVIGELLAQGDWMIGGSVDSLLWLRRWPHRTADEPTHDIVATTEAAFVYA